MPAVAISLGLRISLMTASFKQAVLGGRLVGLLMYLSKKPVSKSQFSSGGIPNANAVRSRPSSLLRGGETIRWPLWLLNQILTVRFFDP